MGLKIYAPDLTLKNYVHQVIIAEFDSLSSVLKEITLVPDCYQYLCFILEGKPKFFEKGHYVTRPSIILTGLHVVPTQVLMEEKCCFINVQFKPFGLYNLFNVPQQEIINSCFDGTIFMGTAVQRLLEKLAEATTSELQNQLIQSYLKDQLKTSKCLLPIDHALNLMFEKGGNQSIECTAALSCLSLKQFERLCKLKVGICPKYFSKLVRFSNLYRLKEKHPELPWCRLAIDCGYYDQMHMIRDFKQFTGENPKIVTKDDIFRSFPFD